MREGFLKFGNWAKSTEMALYASVPRIAIAYHIPLMFLGENPAIQLGDLDVGSLDWNANGMKNANTIKEGPEALLCEDVGIEDLIQYKFPSNEEMEKADLQIVYLGYFWKNFTKIDNANYSLAHGLEIRTDSPANMGALHPFEALDEDFVFVNQYMKFLKFGFGKVTDEVCEEVRFGRMSREEAIELVKKYDGLVNDQYIDRFCDYIDISRTQFEETIEQYVNKDLFTKVDGRWVFKKDFFKEVES